MKKRLVLRKHTLDDFKGDYISWLDDEDVLLYTETEKNVVDYMMLVKYAQNEEKKGNVFLAVEDIESKKHIGNLKIYNIRTERGKICADYSRFIGNKEFWGKGYGQELGKEALRYCFSELKIDVVRAGCRIQNTAAIISSLKLGFEIDKIDISPSKKHLVDERSIHFSISADRFLKNNKDEGFTT